jgi:hypothetical protein
MIRLSSRIGKRYLEVFHVSQAVVRTHGSIVGRFEGFRCLKERHGEGTTCEEVKIERVVQRLLLTSRRD